MRHKLTAGFVHRARCEPGCDRSLFWDTQMPGFGLQVTETGKRSWVIQYRLGRRSRRMAINGVLDLPAARKEAKKLLGEAAKGGDPLGARRLQERSAENTLRAVATEYFDQERPRLRSIAYRERAFVRLVYPVLGQIQINEIRRRDIARLLEGIAKSRGEAMASLVHAFLRRLMAWHANRSDDADFRSPMAGMTWRKTEARERILSDEEIRTVWRATVGQGDVFNYLVRFLLLTACRRDEAIRMTRQELTGDVWTIPASRYKTKRQFELPLSAHAKSILEAIPNIGDFVFTTNGRTPIGGISTRKAALDAASGTRGWTLHDLRRTSRSLMSRAGVSADIGERCLGHSIAGIRGVYDRHDYLAEMKRAFELLAQQIERIINPTDNVVLMHKEVPA